MSRGLTTALAMAAAAAFLRAQFIFFPTDVHIDETIVAELAVRTVATGRISANWDGLPDPQFSRPTYQFSPYTLLENALAAVSHFAFGSPNTRDEHIRFARGVSVALGGLAVLVCYFASTEWFGNVRAALLAELFLATAFLHVQDCGYARVEAMLSLTVLLGFWAAGAAMNDPKPRRWILLGLALGFCIATKYNAAPILLLAAAPLLGAGKGRLFAIPRSDGGEHLGAVGIDSSSAPPTRLALLADLPRGGGRFLGAAAPVAVVLVMAVVGFLLATPEAVVKPGPLVGGIRYEIAHYSEGHLPHEAMDTSDGNLKYWWNYLVRLGVGWTPTLAALGFVAMAPWFGRRDWLLALFLVVAAGLVFSSKVRFERNAEIFLGPACVAAGRFVAVVWDALRRTGARLFAGTAIIAALSAALVQHGAALYDFRQQQRRTNSPLVLVPEVRGGGPFLGKWVADPLPPGWEKNDVLLLYGYSDAFSQRGLQEWTARLRGDWNAALVPSEWYTHGYPFSTVETYHGPGFILRAERKRRASK